MARDEAAHEAAQRHDLVAAGTSQIEHAFNELRAEAAAFERAWHLSMQNQQRFAVAPVVRERNAASVSISKR